MNEIIQVIAPFAGAGLCGYMAGYTSKKFLKVALKAGSIIAGLFFMGMFAMQYQGYISVDWDKIGLDIYNVGYSAVSLAFANNLDASSSSGIIQNIVNQIGYSAAGGFGGGFMWGFSRTK